MVILDNIFSGKNNQHLVCIREMLQILIRRFGLLQKEGAECCGLTLVQSHVLYEINRLGNPSLNDITDVLGLDKSTVSRHVQGLVEQGLIERRQSAIDRRYVELILTEQGKKYEDQISNQMLKYLDEIMSHIAEEKRDQVNESISLLLMAMKNSSCC
ncbi:MarR family winged helix-turn-helix transcriptional regulator [Geobacillus sp. Y412MC52]|uniref:MarR family winged helix-turn-helix transcriptional regulator n=1 Tax=Geobacillus sp. (strain Y412MC52) TaxID=550542 RepID=UPI001E45AFF2|nr:MarR family transcriptional regulator [Geobacillus sp. Y412MC52]